MSAVIVRLPQEKRERLKALAQARGTSVNKLMEEMMTILIADFDAETRFRLRASRGQVANASALLDRVGKKRRAARSKTSARR
ncbi:MAG: toxin-antitoxin system HicB family antitoxin [Gammaproteobacteria bacterium]|nr:MAG: toxin-antitoxin system HicB family antitoxin [Gammaproteobacteria bacterium]